MTIYFDIRLVKCQFVTCSNKQLLLHKVNARDFLSDRMFNLKPSIHFQKVEVLFIIHEKLNSSRSSIATRPSQLNRLISHFLSCDLVHS